MENSLIITIVRKGWGDKVIDAALKAGATGATIVFGRGLGIHEQQKLLGIAIEPEKEIVLTVTAQEKAEGIMDEIIKVAEMDKPGRGIGFILPVQKIVGMTHILAETSKTAQPPQPEQQPQSAQQVQPEQPGQPPQQPKQPEPGQQSQQPEPPKPG